MTGAKEHPPGGAESVIDTPSLHPMNPKLGEGPRFNSTERWVMRRSSTRGVLRPPKRGGRGPVGVLRPSRRGGRGPVGVLRPSKRGGQGPVGVLRPSKRDGREPGGVLRPSKRARWGVGPVGSGPCVVATLHIGGWVFLAERPVMGRTAGAVREAAGPGQWRGVSSTTHAG